MVKERTVKKIKNQTVKKAVTDKGEEQYIIVTDETQYSFTNRRAGAMFFKRETGAEDMFAPGETKIDITEKERKMLVKTLDYQNGWVVEEGEVAPESDNSLNDRQLEDLIEKKQVNPEEVTELY